MSWYLRTKADHDTHHGELSPDGIVTATCGVKFTPLPLPYDRVSLPGYPQDRDQTCPGCDTIRREQGASRSRSTHSSRTSSRQSTETC